MDAHAQPQDSADWARQNLTEQVRHLELLALQLRQELDAAGREREMFRTAAEERLAALLETEQQRLAGIAVSQTLAEERRRWEVERRRLQESAANRESERDRETARLQSAIVEKELLVRHAAASERLLQQELVELQNEGLIHLVNRKLRESLAD